MTTLDELKKEADVLGVKYNANIGEVKLQEKLDTYYASQAADDLVKEKPEVTEEVTATVTPAKTAKRKGVRERANDRKKKAFQKRIVTITNNDKRDSHMTTTAYLSVENQFFGLSKIVPLDIPVELEQCLIDVAKSVEIVLHVDEIVDGKRTGNKRPQYVKKYVVSYEDVN